MGSGSSTPQKGKLARQLSSKDETLKQLKGETRDSNAIKFINFDDFKARTSFPRYPENFDITTDVSAIDQSKALMVFISHHWLQSTPEDDEDYAGGEMLNDDNVHPDSEFHEKFLLCVAGIQLLLNTCAPKLKKCYVWLDYGCINQNGNPASKLKSLSAIMECCDCIFTPIVDTETWELCNTEAGLYEDYLAESFSDYMERAWCRTELWYATAVPMSKLSLGKLKNTYSSLRNAIYSKRRPHYVYGSKEFREQGHPICFPPLADAFFAESPPAEGLLSQPRDLRKIEQLVKELKPFLSSVKLGYEGKKNALGQLHGKGSFRFSSGNKYDGSYKNNKRDGYGKFVFANGNLYNGEWKEDRRHGQGTYSFVSGELYVGQWEMNKKHGHGRFEYASGNVYEGMYKNDKKHGQGKLTFADGKASYDGMYNEDKMDGYGVFRFADGDVYEGQWKNDMKHGQGKYTGKNNETYVGEWKNNLQHGQGKYCFFNGDKCEQ
mmetsp:Transcript_24712/g.46053  ORF Transcript_24712/g.46053 Transcript_24712/m.46053 type:complete len:492 (-) Transcript_24712:352-1827(-)